MKAKMSIVTLGVADLEASRRFYEEGLGFPREGEEEGIVFFKMEGTWLSLYPKEKLAEDIGIAVEGSGFSGVTIAHNVASKEEVEAVLSHAKEVGATIVKEAQDVFWGGYSGYFQDLDGYLWEVAWNPFVDLT